MLLIRTKRKPIAKKKKLLQFSAHTIGNLIQLLLFITAVPVLVIWSGMSLWDSATLVIKYLHLIIPAIVAIIWIVRTLFNIGQSAQQH